MLILNDDDEAYAFPDELGWISQHAYELRVLFPEFGSLDVESHGRSKESDGSENPVRTSLM